MNVGEKFSEKKELRWILTLTSLVSVPPEEYLLELIWDNYGKVGEARILWTG